MSRAGSLPLPADELVAVMLEAAAALLQAEDSMSLAWTLLQNADLKEDAAEVLAARNALARLRREVC